MTDMEEKERVFPFHEIEKINFDSYGHSIESFRTKFGRTWFERRTVQKIHFQGSRTLQRPFVEYIEFCVLCFALLISCARASSDGLIASTSVPAERTQSHSISSTVGAMAQLPCNISATLKNDSVRLVLWYKESVKGGPIYSVDSRHQPLASGRHFSALVTFASRASFNVYASPAVLTIDPVDTEDAGEYKCRVDFRRGRTTVTVVTLNIIVPPKKLYIFDENGEHLAGRTQPVNEGSNLKVICQASGGYPPPSLKWRHEGVEIDASYDLDAKDNKTVTNELILNGVGRSLIRTVLTCEASSSSYSYSVNASVSIDLNLKPLTVQIVRSNKSLIAGRRVELVCQSSGSRPPAVLTWIKNKRKLSQMRESISTNGNTTTSTLSFVPSIEDNGLILVCKAENVRLPNSAAIEDKLLLDVFYEPRVTLVLRAEDGVVREGETVRMECLANGRPSSLDIQWTLDDVALRPTTTEDNPTGFLVNNSILVIKSARREDSGKYRCLASNLVGRTQSNDLQLAVQYPPTCREGQKLVYGVGLSETARVLCDVDALPTELTFRWTLNESSDFELSTKYPTNSELTRSSILYTTLNRGDYGTLQCWGRNAAGDQKKPCTFTILPAGRPEAPRDCLVSSIGETSSSLTCRPGYDGGLEQNFFLEVYTVSNSEKRPRLASNLSSRSLQFELSNLLPDTSYNLILFSSNLRGRSEKSVLLSLSTRPMNALIAGEQSEDSGRDEPGHDRQVWAQATWTLIVIVALLGLLALIRKFTEARTVRGAGEERPRGEDMARVSADNKLFDKDGSPMSYGTEYRRAMANNMSHCQAIEPDIIPAARYPLRIMVTDELGGDAAVALYSIDGPVHGQFLIKSPINSALFSDLEEEHLTVKINEAFGGQTMTTYSTQVFYAERPQNNGKSDMQGNTSSLDTDGSEYSMTAASYVTQV